jgi:hypothetical protein
MSELRVGLGVDAHALVEGVPLVLGGVRVESPRGLAGHSDQHGGTHGSPVDPLLQASAPIGSYAGCARAKPGSALETASPGEAPDG